MLRHRARLCPRSFRSRLVVRVRPHNMQRYNVSGGRRNFISATSFGWLHWPGFPRRRGRSSGRPVIPRTHSASPQFSPLLPIAADANSLPMSAQADLLGYPGQQLVAHGAVIFAILTAAFTFMGTMRPKNQDLWRILAYVGIAGVLIGAGLYTLCRMLWYGALVDSLMRIPCSCEDLRSYFSIVVKNAKTDLSSQVPYRFIALFSSSVHSILSLLACVCAGIFSAFLAFLIGPVDSTTVRRLAFPSILFLLIAVAVIIAALLQII
jgi:hypothetical protein